MKVGSQSEFDRLREEMVRIQIAARGVRDQRVLDAVRKVPRHIFVPEPMRNQAYKDSPLPIGESQTISQPYIVAAMTEALKLSSGDRVLEIGTGSGYQTAILGELANQVYSVESRCSLLERARRVLNQLGYQNITTRCADGTMGWREHAPYNAIIVTAGAPSIPEPLQDQLDEGGRMVVPVGNELSQDLVKVVKEPEGLRLESLGGCRFVKLVGESGWRI